MPRRLPAATPRHVLRLSDDEQFHRRRAVAPQRQRARQRTVRGGESAVLAVCCLSISRCSTNLSRIYGRSCGAGSRTAGWAMSAIRGVVSKATTISTIRWSRCSTRRRSFRMPPGTNVEDPNRFGPLLEDRPHVLKIFGSYAVTSRLSASGFLRIQSGTPWNARARDWAGRC